MRASGKDSSNPQTHNQKQKRRRNRRTIGFMPLEPRIMYDGAAAASASVAHHHADHHDIANGSGMPGGGGGAPASGAPGGAPGANAAPAATGTPGGNDWSYHGHWSGEQGQTGSIGGDKAPGTGPAPTVPSIVNDPSSTPGNSMAPTVGSLTADHTPITQVVFVDSQTPDVADLLSGVKPGVAVFEIDSGSDGLAQIAKILADNHFSNLTAIDIVGHGQANELTIGSTNLNDGAIAGEAQYLSAIGKALVPGGDLMLYGCDVAAGAAGQQFIDDLSAATGGANVAASTKDIGTLTSTNGNGTFENWTLDAATGTIDAVTPFTQAAMDSYQGLLSGTTVTATGFTTTLTVDADGDGGISPGDTVTSQVTINDTTGTAATGVAFSETLSGLTELTNVTITPIGVSDSYTMVGNTPENFDAAHGVLANDIDFNGDTLTVDTAKGASNVVGGSVTLNSDGSFTFTPTTGFEGTASFQYFVKDAAGDADQVATATITVTAPVWYVDSAASSSGADGSFAHPYQTVDAAILAANTTHAGTDGGGVNNTIFVENAGSTYSLTGHIQLVSGEQLLGDGAGVTTINGNTVGLSGTNPTISVSTTDYVVQLNSGNTISGINITNTGSGAGIIDDGGTIGTLTMSNIAVNTASGASISLTHGGTVDITGTSNTINNTAGTALDITNTTIGSEGVTFKSISAGGNGLAAGIILDNTGTTAGLTVTGDGSAAAGGDGSGGTISNETGGQILTGTDAGGQSVNGTQGVGIFLENTFDPSFTNMALHNFSNFGIYGLNVNGFTLFNSTVNTTSGANGQSSSGDRENGSIRFDNLTGIAAITGSTIAGGYDEDFMLQNTSGTLTQLTINNDTFGLQPETTGNNIWVTLYNIAVASTTITNNTFLGARDDFITEAGNNASTLNAIVETNHFEFGETPDSGGADPISVSGYDGTFDIVNNTVDSAAAGSVDGWQLDAIFVEAGNTGNNSASFSGTIDHNQIGSVGNIVAVPGTQGSGDPIAIRADGGGTLTALIENNTIGAFGNTGIYIEGEQGTNTINATLFGNVESNPDSQLGAIGLQVTAGALNTDDSVVNLAVGSATTGTEKNTFTDDTAGWDVGYSTDGTSSAIHLSADGSGSTDPKTVFQNDNTLTNNSGGVTFNTSGGPGAPAINVVGTTPTQPAAEPTFLSSGFSISGTDSEGLTLSATQVASEYQWQESFSGTEYFDIAGANASTYTLKESDVGATLRLIETSASSSVVSAATSAGNNGFATVADNLTLTTPAISGTDTVGQILTASTATSDNSDATITYQWEESSGGAYTAISGADGQTLRLTSALAGDTIKVVATATDPHGGNVSTTSGATGTIGAFSSQDLSNVSIGTLPGNDSVTVSWEATVNAQSAGLIVNPTYTGSVTGSNFTTAAASSTVTLDTLSLEGEIFNDANGNGTLDGGETGISGVAMSVFVQGSSTALESTSTNGSGVYDFTGLAAGNYYVEITSLPATYGNSSPVRDTTPNDYLGSRNYGLAVSSGVISTNAITIAYDQPHPTGPTTYPGDDTTNTLDIGLTKNPIIGNTGNTVDFYQGNSTVAIDSGLTLADPVNVTSATVTISSGFLSGDTLDFTTTVFGDGAIVSGSQSGNVLTLTTTSGTATAADYQIALDSVKYSFTGDPTNAGADKTRTVTWSVSDSNSQTSASGTTSTIDVFVTPVLAAGAGFTVPVMTTAGALAADSALTVADVNTTGTAPVATVTISNGFDTGDTLSYNGGLAHTFIDGGQITGAFNAGTHALTLTGTAGTSAADFQAALEAVQFNTTNSNANDGTRTLTWVFNDKAGGNTNNSNSLTTTFNVEFPPTVGNTGNTAEFYQNQSSGTLLDGAITVTDPNVAVTSASATISSGFLSGDTLDFTTTVFGDGAIVSGSQSGNVLTLTTTHGTATAADYQIALESVGYSFTGDPTNAGADKVRTVTWSVTDANNQTSAAGSTTTLDVFALPIVAAGAAGTPTENSTSGPVIADSTLTITDYNGTTIHNASVQITSGDVASDQLTINGLTNGTVNGITYSFTGSTLTLTGTDTVAHYQSALDLVKFNAVSPNSGTRTLTWEVNDQAGGNTNNSAPVTTNVNVAFGAQVVAGGSATFDGGSATPVTLDSTLTVTDPSSTTLNSATVSIGANFVNGDSLDFTNQNGITGSYDAVHGILTLSGTATVAQYQSALESVAYSFNPANGDPTSGGGDTSRTISWTASDSTTTSTPVTSTLTVVHEPPTLTAGATSTFEINGAPVTADATLTASAVDSGGNLTSATVSIGTGFTVGDTLNFTNQNSITGTYDAVHGILTLSGTSSASNYQTALDSITFSSTVATAGTRTLDWTVTDGSSSNGSSNTATSTVDLTIGPQVTAGGTATFDGGGSPVTLDGTLTVSDALSANLNSATVSIGASFVNGDTLNFTNQNSITGAYDSVHGVLTLTGTASVADYQTALDSITYSFSPSNGDPTSGGGSTSRTISWTVNDGNATSAAASSTLDTVHTAPTVTAGATSTFELNGPAVTADITLNVSDVDSAGNLLGATVQIGTGFTAGDLLNFTNQNSITGSYDAAHGILTLSGTSSVSNYQTALDSITFSTTVTTAGTRTLDWSVTDGSSSNGISNTDTSTIDVVKGPQITAGAVVIFDGGSNTPVTLDSTLTVTDVVHATLNSATVSISTGFITGDELNFTNQNGITGSYDSVHGTLTLTGTSSLTNYQTALDSITYSFSPTNGDPTNGGIDASRTISWSANDGTATSDAVTSTVGTAHVAPTVTAGAIVQFTGGSNTPVILDSSLTVSDVDSNGNLTSALVYIAGGFNSGDTLNFVNQNGIIGSYDSVHGTLTLTGTSSVSNYQTALESVTYSFSPSNGDPSSNGFDFRLVGWTVSDGSSSNGSGGDTSIIEVNHVAPTVTAGSTVIFDGGSTPVTLDSTLTLSDPDSGGNLTSTTVEVASGFLNGDTLNFINQSGISGSYDAVHGILTLTGTSSISNYQTALESVTYSFSPTNGDPTNGGGDINRSIAWLVNDGNTITGQGAAGSTIDVVHVAPVVTASGTATFNGGGGPVTLDSGLTVSDVDSGGDLTGATVQVGTGFLNGDTLNFTNQNGISGSYDAVHGTLTLTGTSSITNYQTALESVTYSFSPSNGDPTNGETDTSRTISWSVTDGSTSNGTSNTSTSTLDTTHTPPTVIAGAAVTFDGGGSPVTLDSTVTVTDPDSNGNLSSAFVTINTGFVSGDTLNFTNQNGITGSYDALHGQLTLTGTASLADYQTALDSVTYSFTPTNGDPTNGGGATSRTIAWTADDGESSDTGGSTLTVVHVAPAVTAGGTATFDGGSTTPVTLDGTATVSDVDSNGNLASATVSISSNFLNGDTLNFTNQNGITGSYDSTHGILTLSGPSSVTNYQTALDSIAYSFSPTNGDPTNAGVDASRTLSWTVTDGSTSNGTSNTATSTLDTVHVAPVVTAGATATFELTGPAVTADGPLTLTDVDSDGTLTGAAVKIGVGYTAGDSLNFTNQNGINGFFDTTTGILTLLGNASVADYQAALDSVTFSSTVASTGTRTLNWTVNDGSASNGISNTDTSTIDLVVGPLVTAGGTATFNGGSTTPVTLDGALTVSDSAQADLTGASVSISSGFFSGDVLNFTNQNGITGSYDAVHGTLTLSGTSTVSHYQTALDSITYSFSPSNADPTNGGGDTSRTISWTATDSVATSTAVTSSLTVNHTAPTVTTLNVLTGFTGGGPAVTLDGELTVSDPDSGGNLTGATVSIGTGFISGDVLNFTNQNSITGSYDAVHGILTLTGTSSVANYQTALESIAYGFSPSNGDPTGGGSHLSRTIDWSVTDGSSSNGTGTGSSHLEVFHAAPFVTAGANVTFNGGGSPVTLDSTLTASDLDSNGNLAGATVSIGTGFTAGDLLNFTNQNGITGSYDAVHGILTLTGPSSVTNYQAALDSITYSFNPTNGDPTNGGGDTSRTISWTVTDGNTSNGTSNTATSTLDVVHVAPVVTAGGTATFDGGGSPVTLDGALSVSDADSSGHLSSATVSVSSGFLSGDMLNFTNQAGISGSYDAVHGILTLTGTASIGNYNIALDSITYSFSPANGDPTNGGGDTARTITWTVSDGSTSNGTSVAKTSTLDVVHEPPTVTAGATVTLSQNSTSTQSAIMLDGALTLADPDSNGLLTGATVSISSGFLNNALNTDVLSFTNQNGITGSYDAVHGVLTLSGPASIGNYQAALESITFNSVGPNPTSDGADLTRTISWTVTDGNTSNGHAAAATSTVDVEAFPTVVAGASVNFQAGLFGTPVKLDPGIGVYDSTNITGATVSLGTGFQIGDLLIASTSGTSIHTLYNPLTGVMTLTGTDTPQHYDQVLQSVSFTSAQLNNATVPVSWQVTDQNGHTSALPAKATSAVHVTGALFPVIPQPPVFNPPPYQPPHSGSGDFFGVSLNFPDNGPASFDGQSVIPLHADIHVSLGDNGTIDFSVPLGVLEASLNGDVVSITATLPDGKPLPDWLHFNPGTGKFAGTVPGDVLTGSLPPGGGNTGGGNQGGLVPDTLTIEVIARDAKGDIAIIDFTINLKPDNGTHHGWNLPGDLRNIAPIELPHQHAQFLPHHGLPAPLLAAANGHDHGAGHGLAGRAGLSQQLAGHGLHGMHANRMALLESLRHATAGHG